MNALIDASAKYSDAAMNRPVTDGLGYTLEKDNDGQSLQAGPEAFLRQIDLITDRLHHSRNTVERVDVYLNGPPVLAVVNSTASIRPNPREPNNPRGLFYDLALLIEALDLAASELDRKVEMLQNRTGHGAFEVSSVRAAAKG